MKKINVKERFPEEGVFVIALFSDGINICRYSEKDKAFIDREGWHYKDVEFWYEME